MKTGRILNKNGVMVNQALLILSAIVYIIYTIPTLWLGIRDGFFCDGVHITMTIWGGLVTIITIYFNYNMIGDLRRTKKYNFYTSRDMAIVKMDQAKRKAEIKRGEVKGYGNEYIAVCGCGVEGCFIHNGYDSVPQEQMNEWEKKRYLDRNKKRK